MALPFGLVLSPEDIVDITHAGIIFFFALLFAFIIRKYVSNVVLKLVARTKTTIDDYLLPQFTRPFFLGIILGACYLSVKSATRFSTMQSEVDQAGIVILIAWVAYTAIKLLSGLAAWYFSQLSPDRQKVRGYTNILKIILHCIIWLIAASMILHKLGIDITPLVATLGVGGLAVGLALQDTLANLFAGFYIVIEKSLEPGDYIEMDGVDVKGHIEEISWRTTKIKTLGNNRVIVPNSKLAQTITTNFTLIDKTMYLGIPVHVSYDNNLDVVERAMKKSLKDFVKENPHAVKSAEPGFSFSAFGESNIECYAGLTIDSFDNFYSVRTALIKHLKKEMERHKITISYPRVVVQTRRASFIN